MSARAFTFAAIGAVRCDQVDKFATPRQPFVAGEIAGLIELAPGRHFEHALADLALFTHIWVLFVFDRNDTWHPKVMPPMGSDIRRGVFATRSPHRPNPIGMSVLRLHHVDGLTLHVSGLDILDGTPVLDIKPYVPVADVIAQASAGWLAPDAAQGAPAYHVAMSAEVETRLAWWEAAGGEPLRDRIAAALQVAPQPRAFGRIRKGEAGALVLGLPGWRVHFRVVGEVVQVIDLRSAHKPSHWAKDPGLHLHRDFIAKFGA